jgi:hypothetical protein
MKPEMEPENWIAAGNSKQQRRKQEIRTALFPLAEKLRKHKGRKAAVTS